MSNNLSHWLISSLRLAVHRLPSSAGPCARRGGGLVVTVALLLRGAGASAQQPAPQAGFPELWLARSPLTGDWGGARSYLEQHGLTLEFYETVDALADVSGGIHRRTDVLGNGDLLATFDLEPLTGWPGGTLFLHGLDNYGPNPSANAGDLQGVSSIAAYNTWKLFEAWYEQDFSEHRYSVLAGLYDVNTEFDVLPSASLFVNSAYGINSALGLSGINGPSTFPTTSLAARVQLRPKDWLYLRAAAAEGVPGDPANPAGTQIQFRPGDGVLAIGEIGILKHPSKELRERIRLRNNDDPSNGDLRYGYFGKYAVGIWSYTSQFNDFWRTTRAGVPAQHEGCLGAYFSAEQRVYFEPDHPRQGLTVFARVGVADRNVNPVDLSLSGGLVYTGLLPGRDTDRLGVGVAAARLGRDYAESLRLAGTRVAPWETAVEMSYRIRLTPAIGLQPDLQYVIHPGGNAQLGNAVVVGARLVVSF